MAIVLSGVVLFRDGLLATGFLRNPLSPGETILATLWLLIPAIHVAPVIIVTRVPHPALALLDGVGYMWGVTMLGSLFVDMLNFPLFSDPQSLSVYVTAGFVLLLLLWPRDEGLVGPRLPTSKRSALEFGLPLALLAVAILAYSTVLSPVAVESKWSWRLLGQKMAGMTIQNHSEDDVHNRLQLSLEFVAKTPADALRPLADCPRTCSILLREALPKSTSAFCRGTQHN